jgi:hypothetical protein
MGLLEAVVICGIMRSSVERKTSRTYRHLVIEFVDSDHRNYNVTFAGRADPIRVVECDVGDVGFLVVFTHSY